MMKTKMPKSARSLRHRERGAALVEFAVVIGPLLLLMLGIIEFGLMFRDALLVEHLGRDACREACIGANQTTTDSTVTNIASASGLVTSNVSTPVATYSTDGGVTYTGAVFDSSGNNTAPVGDLVKVQLNYIRPFTLGGFFSWMSGATFNTTLNAWVMTLYSTMIAQRESS